MSSLGGALRRRLSLGLTALGLLLGIGLFLLTRHLLTERFDAALFAKAGVLCALVTHEPGGAVEVDFAEEPMPEFVRAREAEYYQITGPGGRVVNRSPSLGGAALALPTDLGLDPRGFDLALPDGRSGRALALRFAPVEEEGDGEEATLAGQPPAPALVLVLARDRAELDAALGRIGAAIGLTGLLMVLGAALIVGAALRRGLRPLDVLAAQAQRIDAGNLGARFPTGGLPEELAAIAGRLNDLLARLESSFARERRFSADVAHELRTPLAELRALAEVSLHYPDPAPAPRTAVPPAGVGVADGTAGSAAPARTDDAAPAAGATIGGAGVLPRTDHAVAGALGADLAEVGAGSLADVLEITLQMEHLVQNLLALARCDAGQQQVALESVDLAALVRAAWRPHAAAADARGLSVHFDLPEAAAVRTDRTLTAAILGNLLGNAVAYTPSGGEIHGRLEVGPDGVRLEIANATAGLGSEDLPHLFEPFWRKDSARSDRGHAGLGLALVSALARLCQIQVGADLPATDRLRFLLRFLTA